ncbi:thiol:disulfide interchange protein DsbD [Thiomicrorhabdus immobilis]|uniref:Thiol:disulfide interchange protein DsbD n=1 Tax=Thiomicrorhabdus immobilis TaxID=2791037 RepID=A0ABM7MF14_9GAMM|nr:protein-disulfide reductase DsbD [Thiomicrorhabdus immobilis]BCN93988.1 thiol:disulfide interchange protein DsbD [Thiomicrorhabdus immobilis]
MVLEKIKPNAIIGNHYKNLISSIFMILLTAFSFTSYAADELLEVDDAFVLQQPMVDNQAIQVHWKIADDYKLYKDKISVTASNITLAEAQFSKAETVDDALFGKSEVFHGSASVTIPYTGTANTTELTVKYQGCADKIGVCYPPQTRTFTVALPSQTISDNQTGSQNFGSLSALNNFLKQDNEQPELLDAEDAFAFSHSIQNGQLELNWNIAKDYHLYQDKIKASVVKGNATLQTLKLPKAELIDDELFGKTMVYHGQFSASLPIAEIKDKATIQIEYQGCSAASGVCYPPVKKQIEIDAKNINTDVSTEIAQPAITADNASNTEQLSETDQIADTLKNSSVWIVIATFFIFGLLLAFTPCVFPMIPILSSIIVGQGDQLTTRRAFVMSLVYVLAMSVTYTVAGVLAGIFGENLQVAFQNPWIIGSFAVIFILLAFSMFGFYELQLPSSLQSKLTNISNKQQGGTLTGVAIMGFLSALIVGPCVAPPLAGALIYIGQTGDALLGGTALFAMSMGMGLPLLLLGTSAGKLLPRAGAWMDNVKAVFGVMLIGIAIWMAERIVPAEVAMLSWALLFIISAVYLGTFETSNGKTGWAKLAKGFGIALFLYGAMILVGLLGGSKQMFQPLKVFQGGGIGVQSQSEHLSFKTIKSQGDLEAELAKGNPVMLDFYADWCISCKEMEALTFTDAGVHAALKGVTLLQADVTANDATDKALMKQFGIIGPPAILFFNTAGTEQKAQRVVGFKKAEDFTQNINKAFK